MIPQPPSRTELTANLRLLVADWKRGNAAQRYFIASLFLATMLSGACTAASLVSLVLGAKTMALVMGAVSGLCLAHAFGTRAVLRRRFQIRFDW